MWRKYSTGNKIAWIIIIFLLTVLVFFIGSSEDSVKNKPQSKGILAKGTTVKMDKFSFKLSRYYIIKTEGDNFKDVENIYSKIEGTSFDNAKLGFDIGYHNAKSEVSKRDGYLVLILDYNPDKKLKVQRNSIIPKMDVSAVDDKGDDAILIHDSLENKYINIKKPMGILLFKIFTDAKNIDLTFGTSKYNLKIN